MVLCVISVWGRELGQGRRLTRGSAALNGDKAMGQTSFTPFLWGSPAPWDQGWGTGAVQPRLGTSSSVDLERGDGVYSLGGVCRVPREARGSPGVCRAQAA